MSFEHVDLVLYAKSYGLIYMVGMFVAVIIYACWPKNKDKFTQAASSILDEEDKPCQ